jgi:hypothetical protein
MLAKIVIREVAEALWSLMKDCSLALAFMTIAREEIGGEGIRVIERASWAMKGGKNSFESKEETSWSPEAIQYVHVTDAV